MFSILGIKMISPTVSADRADIKTAAADKSLILFTLEFRSGLTKSIIFSIEVFNVSVTITKLIANITRHHSIEEIL